MKEYRLNEFVFQAPVWIAVAISQLLLDVAGLNLVGRKLKCYFIIKCSLLLSITLYRNKALKLLSTLYCHKRNPVSDFNTHFYRIIEEGS